MGNASKKLAAQCTLLSRDEQKVIAAAFRLVSRNSDKIREEELIKLWGPQMDPRLAQFISNFLFGAGGNKAASADFQRFAELFVYNVRGTLDERLLVTYNSLGQSDENEELAYQLLKEYCESIASTYIKMIKSSGGKSAREWIGKGFRGRPQHVQALGETLAAGLAACAESAPAYRVSRDTLSQGFQNDMLLKMLSELVFRQLYAAGGKRRGSHEEGSPGGAGGGSTPHAPELLPAPLGLDAMPDYPAFVDLAHLAWLNAHLPAEHRHQWRFLFSTHIHGESFSTMIGRIVECGPSVLIVEDSAGYIFGGFAPQSWAQGPNFFGTEQAFLFTLSPRMRCYPATGYNDHYQYLNTHQKTMPNGLMMGGQFEYGGIWLDYEFGRGSSAESCSTFRGYQRLSKDKHFRVRSLEVWGIGDKPLTVAESGERDTSVLDGNCEAKALLKMAGREQHSEGLREPAPL